MEDKSLKLIMTERMARMLRKEMMKSINYKQ